MKAVAEIKPNYAPVYAAALYPELAKVFQRHGYALACHGSLARDFDLVAIPWVEAVAKPETVLEDVLQTFALKLVGEAGQHWHGRVAYTLSVGFGECFVDLSFFPKL